MTTYASLFQHDAQLMWTPEVSDTTTNIYVYFRSRLQLDSIDGSSILRIYAKDIYELYANEQFIGMGPYRSAPPMFIMKNGM
jgi:hypothetical protein